MIRSPRSRALAVGGVALTVLLGIAAPTAANAAPPASVPAPADPVQIFAEDFENVQGGGVVGLTAYTGAQGATYTADPFWLNATACNGFVVQGTTPIPFGGDGAPCQNASGAQNRLVDLATVLGHGNAANRAVAAYTERTGDPGETLLTRSINSGIAVQDGRFYVASIDVAEVNCLVGAVQSALDFGLELPSGEVMISGDPAVACDSSHEETINGHLVRSGTFRSPAFHSPESGAAELVVRNRTTNGAGNDFAYDNLRFYDATPSIYKSFAAEQVEVGQPVTMTLDIVNTSDLEAKAGWSFTDALPAGMTVAKKPNLTDTCAADITAEPGAQTVEVADGALAKGAESCTISVDVVLAAGGDYTNTITGASGLDGEPSATIRALVPSMSLVKSAAPTTVTKAGQTVLYTFVLTNDGGLPLHGIAVSDPGPIGGTGTMGPVDCKGVTELAVGAALTCTASYTAGAGDLTGTPLKNAAAADALSPAGTALKAGAVATLTTVKPVPAAGQLAATGGSVPLVAGAAAGVLLLAGAASILIARRRRA